MRNKTGVVRCHKQILNSVSIKNDVGGTSEIPVGNYRVRVTKSWGDSEIGGRCIGVLLDPKDVAKARKAGTTGHKPADYLKYRETNPQLYKDALKAAANFDPSIVYFATSDFTPDAEDA